MTIEERQHSMAATSLEELIEKSPHGEQLRDMMDIFVPLALKLPSLRDDPAMLKATVKVTAENGITDVATEADVYTQQQIKQQAAQKHPQWQFWGEEGEDNVKEYDPSKTYLLVADPVEGTNNYRARKDNQWGSVIALIDITTKEPIIGIVALPAQRRFYVGVKGAGAYVIEYDVAGNINKFELMQFQPEYPEFTYNNSPHFETALVKQVQRFFTQGKVQAGSTRADYLERSRKTVLIPTEDKGDTVFIDPESGVLEAIRNRGTIYFKTSNEMAAVFVIMQELGGKVTDAQGNPWTLGIHSLISARTIADHTFLKSLYDKTI